MQVLASEVSHKYPTVYWANQSQPFQNVTAQYEDYLSKGYTERYWEVINNRTHAHDYYYYGGEGRSVGSFVV